MLEGIDFSLIFSPDSDGIVPHEKRATGDCGWRSKQLRENTMDLNT